MPFVAFLSLIATNVAGYTKKTTVAALYLIGYCVGNIIGPQVFRPKDAPRYVPAEITIIACWVRLIAEPYHAGTNVSLGRLPRRHGFHLFLL